MASIITDRNGGKRVEFFIGPKENRIRKRIRMEGKPTDDAAKDFAKNLEHLLATKKNGGRRPDLETQAWLDSMSDDMHAKLAAVGLVESREQSAEEVQDVYTLGRLIDEVTALADVKETTQYTYTMSRRFFVEYFGEDKPIANIGPREAEYFGHP